MKKTSPDLRTEFNQKIETPRKTQAEINVPTRKLKRKPYEQNEPSRIKNISFQDKTGGSRSTKQGNMKIFKKGIRGTWRNGGTP